MRLLFWNANKNQRVNEYIVSLVNDYRADALILAEYSSDKKELNEKLESSSRKLTECYTTGCPRIRMWSSYLNLTPGIQEDYYSIQIIDNNKIVCGVHMPTDLHGDNSQERLTIVQKIIHDIAKLESEIPTSKIIIVGDMNEMPYGKSCLNADGFHGLPVWNSKVDKRKVMGIEYKMYYNPMWNLLGDFTYPPGTYYYNRSSLVSPMWYMTDQIIVSRELAPQVMKEELKIITSCDYGDLADKNGRPNKKISDHFPIICEISGI